jgi:hypothetical protein
VLDISIAPFHRQLVTKCSPAWKRRIGIGAKF